MIIYLSFFYLFDICYWLLLLIPFILYLTYISNFAYLSTIWIFQGATIVDQRVCISRWGQYEDEFDLWNRPSWKIEDDTGSTVCLFFHVINDNNKYV